MKQSELLIPAELHAYMMAHSMPSDPIQDQISERTAQFEEVAHWQTAPEQSGFLTLLVQMLQARRVVEVGTFTGMSALAIARGLRPGGELICCDVTDDWTEIAQDAWRAAGVDHLIDLRIAPAIETLRSLPVAADVDFAFVDADKPAYWGYFEELVGRMRPGGVMAFDNVFRSGRVLHPSSDVDEAIIDFNDRLARDERVDVMMLPIADGMSLARVRD
ncbi:SAM-dependent methyltransferase [Aeromicrobium sp. Root495]|uniref:O-methyltransferase n=1 Tax=Aeromicrobium sp. Root495 TaxID=1736550 RepID=UPI000700FDCD|nr:class I SAM-dependent methyltransferase [Aeromicrobium sp. Root495]KQY55335.1 SAM-dependent methyltransferase [Aeromicrobium sp. Root495]